MGEMADFNIEQNLVNDAIYGPKDEDECCLIIEELEDDMGDWMLYTKGHVDKNEFKKCMEYYVGDDGGDIADGEIVYKYARYMPPSYAKYKGCDAYLNFQMEPGRGAFKITCWSS